ncbi:DUF262 domain-containing protein [Moraxella nasovis]|nr:DUF262 domain-containing protein [Moraxella nasovis]
MTVKQRKDKDNEFEVIDEQQRLTTLFLLLSVLKHEFNLKLEFEHRADLSHELQQIFGGQDVNGDSQIAQVYRYLKSYKFDKGFAKKLLERVQGV